MVRTFFSTPVCIMADRPKVWDGPDGSSTARGFVASPFEVHPFEVALTGPLEDPLAPHKTSECSTTYSDQAGSTNPITGQ